MCITLLTNSQGFETDCCCNKNFETPTRTQNGMKDLRNILFKSREKLVDHEKNR